MLPPQLLSLGARLFRARARPLIAHPYLTHLSLQSSAKVLTRTARLLAAMSEWLCFSGSTLR